MTAGTPSLHPGSFFAFSESVDSFLEDLARVRDSEQHVPPMVAPETVFADRYHLKRVLGRGAHGVVWIAADSVSGEDVALKLIAPSRHAARIRAEIGSLRGLRASGVVQLLDEGIDHGAVFIAMPLISGAPFPARRTPLGWDELRGPAESLLLTLAEVHAAGIIHRDLKPANVLVGSDGSPTVLDFGLCVPGFLGTAEDSRNLVGTPAYLAPEQIDGRSVDGRADLYAVGVMLYESLTGRLPHQGPDVRALLAAKFEPPRALAEALPDLPTHVASTIDAMLSPDTGTRPGSASEAIRRLRQAGSRAVSEGAARLGALGPDDHIEESALASLFVESETLSSLPEDAARLVHARTEGNRARISAQIEKWLRDGVCRWEAGPGSRLLLDRSTLDRLELETSFPHVKTDDLATVDAAVDLSLRVACEGRLGLAIALLREVMWTVRTSGDTRLDRLERVLSAWVRVALTDGSPRFLDRVLYELCQTGAISLHITRLEALVRASLSVGAWTGRALDLVSQIPPFEDIDLELERLSIRVLAARRASVESEEEVLESLKHWRQARSDPVVDARFAIWVGRLRYRQGRYVEAAELHEQAAIGPLWSTLKATSIMHAASARMEAFQLEIAARHAQRAKEFFQSWRHAKGSAQAGWFVRTIAYRRGDPLSPDVEWLDQVARLALRETEGLACLTEAAIAWRSGDWTVGAAIATRGLRVWNTMGETAGALLLTSSLAVACSPDGAVSGSEIQSLAHRAALCSTPGVGIQVLALIAKHRGERPSADELALAEQVPRANWHQRIDVLSVDEALKMLRSNG